MSNLSEIASLALVQPVISLVLAFMLMLVIALNWYQGRKMRKLERQLVNQHRYFRQELSMINQSAMGVGQRVKHLEHKFKAQPKVFDQLLAQAAATSTARTGRQKPAQPEAAKAAPTNPEAVRSRAEQSLDLWMQDCRQIA